MLCSLKGPSVFNSSPTKKNLTSSKKNWCYEIKFCLYRLIHSTKLTPTCNQINAIEFFALIRTHIRSFWKYVRMKQGQQAM